MLLVIFGISCWNNCASLEKLGFESGAICEADCSQVIYALTQCHLNSSDAQMTKTVRIKQNRKNVSVHKIEWYLRIKCDIISFK